MSALADSPVNLEHKHGRVGICLAGREHKDDAHAGSMNGSQLNMQTTLDLVLLLLDDIDAGQAISSERTQQLRAILLNDDGAPFCVLNAKAEHQTTHYITAVQYLLQEDVGSLMTAMTAPFSQRLFCFVDLQQPLMLRDLKRKHSQDTSYTGSRVLSFLEQAETDHHLMSAVSSFISVRLPFSSHTSRNQSFATGMVRPQCVQNSRCVVPSHGYWPSPIRLAATFDPRGGLIDGGPFECTFKQGQPLCTKGGPKQCRPFTVHHSFVCRCRMGQ